MLPLVYEKEISGYNLEFTNNLLQESTIMLAQLNARCWKEMTMCLSWRRQEVLTSSLWQETGKKKCEDVRG